MLRITVLAIVIGAVSTVAARYGSDKIRGHGIPESIEAILFGKSRMSPKVALLKPLSSGIVVGSGGPFGAEGPIIMTGGAIGSLIATILAFGLTHDSNALLPLLATSAVAYGFTVLTMRRAIPTKKIARRGYHIYREYGIDPLERHAVEEVMAREVRSIDAALPVARALFEHFGDGQVHRAFLVVRNGAVIGVADRAMLAACGTRDPIATVGDACADLPLFFALPGENCRAVATRLAHHRLERLPVVKDAQLLVLVGIVARSDLIKPSLAHVDEEEKRERMRGLPWQA
nr:chloride channel protein [Variovorax beijingensis]